MSKVFRVRFDPCVTAMGVTPFISDEVGSIKEANLVLNTIANYTLQLHETSLMDDHSNAGWIEKLDDNGTWEEYEEEVNP